MRLLLDTATLLWIATDAPALSSAARDAYRAAGNESFVSVASVWEVIVKHRLGKLPLPGTVEELIAPFQSGAAGRLLPLNTSAVLRLSTLPDVHRDPFDRMLICQALDEGMTIVTPDRTIPAYPVPVIW